MGRTRRTRVVGLSAARWRKARRTVIATGALAAAAVGHGARLAAGAVLSFSGLACAPAAAYVTWGTAGLLWVAFPVLIIAGAAVERMLNAGT